MVLPKGTAAVPYCPVKPWRAVGAGALALGKDLWEVHTDPYDVTRIWVRNHHHGGWITLFWKHLSTAPAPFGELHWNNAISELHDSGVTDPAEEEIDAVVGKLLQRAHDGPPGASTERTPPRRKRRRPNALGRPAVLDTSASRARPPDEPAFEEPETDQPDEDDSLADVVPLGKDCSPESGAGRSPVVA